MTFVEIIEIASKAVGVALGCCTLLALLFKKPKQWIINYMRKVSMSCSDEVTKPLAEKIEKQHQTIDQILISVDTIQKQNDAQNEAMKEMAETQQEMLHKIKLGEEASLDLLRYNFNRIYYMAKRDNGISAHDKENCCNMYKNYKDLKGNSYVDELYKELMTIPVKQSK